MMCGRGILSSILNKNNNTNESAESLDEGKTFLENGSILLEELIAFSSGRYNTPMRRFSVEELHRATEGFSSDRVLIDIGCSKICKGYLENRPVFIKNYQHFCRPSYSRTTWLETIRDLVIMTLMSSHKNVVKILGCCIGLKYPALVCEYAESIQLSSCLFKREGGNMDIDELLTWRSRLKIAYDIANVVVYLHTAFPTPIIHRDLKSENILIDKFGVAKLMDFSLSIAMPPGKTLVEDNIIGTYGFIDPEYMQTGFLNQKSDVFGFGMILLELLTGKRAADAPRESPHQLLNNYVKDAPRESPHQLLNNYVKDYVDKGQFNEVVDPRILEGGAIEQEQQLQALAALALRCVVPDRESRPEMIDVAKEVRRIQKPASPSILCQP